MCVAERSTHAADTHSHDSAYILPSNVSLCQSTDLQVNRGLDSRTVHAIYTFVAQTPVSMPTCEWDYPGGGLLKNDLGKNVPLRLEK